MRRPALTILSLVFLAACQPAIAPLSDEDMTALNDVRAAFVEGVLANDCGATTAVFAQNVDWMPANEPLVEGRAAYRDACEAEASQPAPQDFTIIPLGIDGYGDLAVDRGTWSQTSVSDSTAETVTVTGKYVAIARKEADASWSWTTVIYNYDAPLPQLEQG
jgi:ketosteroid isomerase-like protein